jgi:hypothetical protein
VIAIAVPKSLCVIDVILATAVCKAPRLAAILAPVSDTVTDVTCVLATVAATLPAATPETAKV